MPYFKVCGKCGANLDPGERCDCEDILKKKLVFISHPLTGDIEGNRKKVDALCKDIIRSRPEIIPISPLHLFGYMENDNDRGDIMKVCNKLIQMCEELWNYGVSEGCLDELLMATRAGITIRYRG